MLHDKSRTEGKHGQILQDTHTHACSKGSVVKTHRQICYSNAKFTRGLND